MPCTYKEIWITYMKNLKNEKSKMNTCAPPLRSRVEIVAFHLLHNKATWEAFDK